MTYFNYSAACGHTASVDVPGGTVYAALAATAPLELQPCRPSCKETPYTQRWHVAMLAGNARGHLCLTHLRSMHGVCYSARIDQQDGCKAPCMVCDPNATVPCNHWPVPLTDRERRMLGMLRLAIAYVGKGVAEHAYDGCVVSGEQSLAKLEAFVREVDR